MRGRYSMTELLPSKLYFEIGAPHVVPGDPELAFCMPQLVSEYHYTPYQTPFVYRTTSINFLKVDIFYRLYGL